MGPLAALTLISNAPDQTRRLGEALGRAAQAGDVLLLDGPFGAGKTVLVQGLAAGLGVTHEVTSPSFVMINEHHGRLTLFHVDLYRIEGRLDPETLEALDEYLSGDGVCAIEWPSLLPHGLRANASELRFVLVDDDTRRIEIRAASPRLADAARGAGAVSEDR